MQFLEFIANLAQAFFALCAECVGSYPITTIFVFAFVFLYMHSRGWFVFVDEQNKSLKLKYSASEILYGLIGFIVAVALSNAIGWILSFVATTLGKMLGVGAFLGGPFANHPVEYAVALILFSILALGYVVGRKTLSGRKTSLAMAAVLAFGVLFSTYVSTTIYAAIAQPTAVQATATKS